MGPRQEEEMKEMNFEFDTPVSSPVWFGHYNTDTHVAHIHVDIILFDAETVDGFMNDLFTTITHETIHFVIHMIDGLDATDMFDNIDIEEVTR